MEELLDRLRDTAIAQGKRIITSPTFMKMMADPRVMKVFMKALEVPGKVKSQAGAVAKVFGFATRAELESVKRTVETIESSLSTLEDRLARKPNGSAAT